MDHRVPHGDDQFLIDRRSWIGERNAAYATHARSRTQVLCPEQVLHGTCVAFAARMAQRERLDAGAQGSRGENSFALTLSPGGLPRSGNRWLEQSLASFSERAGITISYAILSAYWVGISDASRIAEARTTRRISRPLVRCRRSFHSCWS